MVMCRVIILGILPHILVDRRANKDLQHLQSSEVNITIHFHQHCYFITNSNILNAKSNCNNDKCE